MCPAAGVGDHNGPPPTLLDTHQIVDLAETAQHGVI
jgi:hypothetical protein